MLNKIIKISIVIITMVLSVSFNVYADINEQITVRVKANVPEDFKSSIAVSYEGKDSEGFTSTLNKGNDYTMLVSLKKDVYVYKESSIADGNHLEMVKTFSLKNATKDNVYLLNVDAIIGSRDNLPQGNVNITFKADLRETDYSGNIAINYTGTDGNEVLVTLNKSNNYIAQREIKKDIYTLKALNLDTGFTYDCLYSFSLLDATNNNEYDLQVKVIRQNEVLLEEDNTGEKIEDVNKAVQERNIKFKATVPANIKDFNGVIYVTYRDNSDNEYTAELSPINTYKTSLYLPLGIYKLEYAISYDTDIYQFSAHPAFEITDSTPDDKEISVLMIKDGKVLIEDEKNSRSSGTAKGLIIIIIAIITLTIMIIILIMIILRKKKKMKAVSIDDDELDDDELDDDIDIEDCF